MHIAGPAELMVDNLETASPVILVYEFLLLQKILPGDVGQWVLLTSTLQFGIQKSYPQSLTIPSLCFKENIMAHFSASEVKHNNNYRFRKGGLSICTLSNLHALKIAMFGVPVNMQT